MPETRKLKHTASDKVHVVGSPEGMIQRCTRCGAKILDNGGFAFEGGRPVFKSVWPVGSLVLSRRRGQSVISAEDAREFRACGRKAGEVSK